MPARWPSRAERSPGANALGTDHHRWTAAGRALVAECEKALRDAEPLDRLRTHLHR